MKRALLLLLAATPCLLSIGCNRRAKSEERQPVSLVTETDLPLPSGGVKKPGKTITRRESLDKLYVVDMGELDKKKATKEEVKSYLEKQKAMESKGDGGDRAPKQKAELAELAAELSVFGRAVFKFFKTNPPKDYNVVKLSGFLRRENQSVTRRYVDTKEFKIVSEEVSLRGLLDENAFDVVYELDINSSDDVLIYKKRGMGTDDAVALLCKQEILAAQVEEVVQRVARQQLRLVWNYYANYSRNTPPDQRSLKGFRATLRDSAPPSLATLVESGTIRMAEPATATEWLAYHQKEYYAKIGYLAVKINGEPGSLTIEQSRAFK